MKSERRHELQHNQLAEWLAKSGEAIKPYQNMIFGVLLVVLVVVAGYTWWSRQAAAQNTQAWEELNAAMESGDFPKLTKVIADYPNTNTAHLAAVVLADYYLGVGCEELFKNKATAQDGLNKAIELYPSVLEQSRSPSLKERATFGLARAREAEGKLEAAEQLYGKVVNEWPDGTYTGMAKQRLNDLKRPATKTLYDRFAHFDPKPAFSPAPGAGPAFDANSLKEPANAIEVPNDLKLDLLDKSKEKGKEAEKKSPDSPKPSGTEKSGK